MRRTDAIDKCAKSESIVGAISDSDHIATSGSEKRIDSDIADSLAHEKMAYNEHYTFNTMKPDPNLTEQEQIGLYDAEIRRNLWQVAALIVLILAALLKGYTLHVEEARAETDNQIALAQGLLNTCETKLQIQPGPTKRSDACKERETELSAAQEKHASFKSNGLNAFLLALFGGEEAGKLAK